MTDSDKKERNRLYYLLGGGAVVAVAVILCLIFSTAGTPTTQATETVVKELGPWKNGILRLVSSSTPGGDTQYAVKWQGGGETVMITAFWIEEPLARITKSGNLGLVVGEEGDFVVHVVEAPNGQRSTENMKSREAAEEALTNMSEGVSPQLAD